MFEPGVKVDLNMSYEDFIKGKNLREDFSVTITAYNNTRVSIYCIRNDKYESLREKVASMYPLALSVYMRNTKNHSFPHDEAMDKILTLGKDYVFILPIKFSLVRRGISLPVEKLVKKEKDLFLLCCRLLIEDVFICGKAYKIKSIMEDGGSVDVDDLLTTRMTSFNTRYEKLFDLIYTVQDKLDDAVFNYDVPIGV